MLSGFWCFACPKQDALCHAEDTDIVRTPSGNYKGKQRFLLDEPWFCLGAYRVGGGRHRILGGESASLTAARKLEGKAGFVIVFLCALQCSPACCA